MGNGYSIAWRILDAQYWGVPQRRRRIFLVADFGGQSAPEILFKRKGLSRYLESGETRKELPPMLKEALKYSRAFMAKKNLAKTKGIRFERKTYHQR